MKKDNRMVQMAFEYAPYRMASSYFEEKPICRSEWMEGKLYFHYQMTKEKEQYQLEDACIRYLEQELWDSVPKELWQASGGEAKLTRRCGANYTEPLFRNQEFLNHVAAILFTAAQSPVPVPFLRYLPARGKPALRRYVPCAGRTYRFWTARSRRQW